MDHRTELPWWRQRFWLVLIGFMAIGGFLLLTEHRAHALGVLPFLLLLVCPLMHLFMHHGHGRHDRHDDAAGDSRHAQHGGGPHAR
jgi:hypothetical protein